MSSDPATLHYLRSIDDRMTRMETTLNQAIGLQGERIQSLEDTRTRQHAVMGAGGVVVTFCSWVVAQLGGGS